MRKTAPARRAVSLLALLAATGLAVQVAPTATARPRASKTNLAPVPVVNPDPSQTVPVAKAAPISAVNSYDPEGTSLKWSWRQVSGPAGTITKTGPGSITFTPRSAGDAVIEVIVTDRQGASATETTLVTATSSGAGSTSDGSTTTTTVAPTTTTTVAPTTTTTVAPTTTTVAPSTTLWSSDFEASDWLSPWKPKMDAYNTNRTVVSGLPGANGRALKLTSKATTASVGWGAQIRSMLPDMGVPARDEAVLRYSFYVPSGWNPYAGGKLPGLAGITGGLTVGGTPGGGTYDERGWSGRLMWLRTLDGNLDRSRLTTYLYVRQAAGRSIYDNRNPDNGQIYGIEVNFRANPDPANPWSSSNPFLYVKRGQWNTIEIRYKMNTPGVADGHMQGWLNGQLGVDLRDVMYRTNAYPALNINEMMFDSFYGGPTGNTTDQTWAFDDVAVKSAR